MAQTKTGKKYYDELNIFRALIIIWVVIGHSFDAGLDFAGLLHNYAYTFHMEAFILLSGFFFYGKVKSIKTIPDCLKTVKDRFFRLMVPYFFYTAVSLVLKFFFNEYAIHKLTAKTILNSLICIENPNGGIWFLYALFALDLVAVILHRLPVPAGFILSAAAYIANTMWGFASNIPILNWVVYYGIFFYLGMLLYSGYDAFSVKINAFFKKRLALCGILSIALAFAAYFAAMYLPGHFSKIKIIGVLVSFVLTLFSIFVYYSLSVFINRLARVKKPFMTIGDYGMDIYLLGYYVQIAIRVVLKSMLGAPYLVYSLLMLVLGLFLPIPVSKYFVRKFRVARILALGDYKKSKPKDDEK